MKTLPRSAGIVVSLLLFAATAHGAPLQYRQKFSRVDWTAAGVGGVGGGSGTIELSEVGAPVRRALLYWQGIDLVCPVSCRIGGGTCKDPCPEAGDGIYDNETVTFAGVEITGEALGDGPTSCWGEGSSRAFRADVTHLVTGAGSYSVSGLSAKPGHSANGASLVVAYDDGDPSNDRDLMFFEGNDASAAGGFPGEDDGWHVEVPEFAYSGGVVSAQFHAADGQSGADQPVEITTTTNNIEIPDAAGSWDGLSVPNDGTGRWLASALWDIHDFDMTSAFAATGPHSLRADVSGSSLDPDCKALVLMVVDLPGGSLPGCVGDCGRDGAVGIDELVLSVNIALGAAPRSECPQAAIEGSESVSIAALIQAVNNALHGCVSAR